DHGHAHVARHRRCRDHANQHCDAGRGLWPRTHFLLPSQVAFRWSHPGLCRFASRSGTVLVWSGLTRHVRAVVHNALAKGAWMCATSRGAPRAALPSDAWQIILYRAKTRDRSKVSLTVGRPVSTCTRATPRWTTRATGTCNPGP